MVEPESYRINEDDEQVRLEQARLLTLARVVDPATRAVLEPLVQPGWQCCDVGSGAGTVVAWLAGRVGPAGRVVSLDVDTRFQPPSFETVEVRQADVTVEPIGEAEFDLVHARGVLQHLVQREAVLAAMVVATKPGGWVVATDTDWIQFDAQAIPDPFATLSSTLRGHSVQQHGYDGAWGRRLVPAFQALGLTDVDATGHSWTMHGGTDSAEWYVGALDRALPVLPREIFPDGFVPEDAVAQAREPDFAILSPLSMTCVGRKPA
ncbi:MAG TPA: methyltransferase domain-containing protein [Acidimicrobiales bacterium]